MTNLNENERKAMSAICADCDEIDGWGFTHPSDAFEVVAKAVGESVAVKLLDRLNDKNIIDVCVIDDTLWVRPELFEQFC